MAALSVCGVLVALSALFIYLFGCVRVCSFFASFVFFVAVTLMYFGSHQFHGFVQVGLYFHLYALPGVCALLIQVPFLVAAIWPLLVVAVFVVAFILDMINASSDEWQTSALPMSKYGEGYAMLTGVFGFVFVVTFIAARHVSSEQKGVAMIAETISSLRLFRTAAEVEKLVEKDDRDLSDLMLLLVASLRTARNYSGFLPGRMIRQLVSSNSTDTTSSANQVSDSDDVSEVIEGSGNMVCSQNCFVGIDLGLSSEILPPSSLLKCFEFLFSEILSLSRDFDCSVTTVHESLLVVNWPDASIVQSHPIEFCHQLQRNLGKFPKMFQPSRPVFVVYSSRAYYGNASSRSLKRFLMAEEERPLTWLMSVVKDARARNKCWITTSEVAQALPKKVGKEGVFRANGESFFEF